MFSSNPQVQEQWSIMIFPIGLPPKESSRCQTFVSPRRKRMWRTTTSCVSTQKDSPAIHTPSPGAVCPAIVTYGARTIMGDSNLIIPETLKTMIRAPPVFHSYFIGSTYYTHLGNTRKHTPSTRRNSSHYFQ